MVAIFLSLNALTVSVDLGEPCAYNYIYIV